ncbi:MAG: DUF167 domain-containing protein [Candidatus Babeliales bacterium]|nr:DUF167 domain-containing protein [Candidatus Babeliales bacterium]
MLIIDLKVVPNSGKLKAILDKAGKLKCYLKSPPEKGLANAELIKFFSKALSISQNDIEIVAGATSRNKRLKIETNLNLEQVLGLFDIEQQITLFGVK